jgi:hypothetical protein
MVWSWFFRPSLDQLPPDLRCISQHFWLGRRVWMFSCIASIVYLALIDHVRCWYVEWVRCGVRDLDIMWIHYDQVLERIYQLPARAVTVYRDTCKYNVCTCAVIYFLNEPYYNAWKIQRPWGHIEPKSGGRKLEIGGKVGQEKGSGQKIGESPESDFFLSQSTMHKTPAARLFALAPDRKGLFLVARPLTQRRRSRQVGAKNVYSDYSRVALGCNEEIRYSRKGHFRSVLVRYANNTLRIGWADRVHCTVGIYPLKEGRHEDACPRVDLLSKGRWGGTASVKDRHAGRLVKCRAEQTTRNWGGTVLYKCFAVDRLL